MSDFLTCITRTLSERGIRFLSVPDVQIVRACYTMQNSNLDWLLHWDERSFQTRSILPFAVPADRRDAMAILIHRLNHTMAVAHFELGRDDGSLAWFHWQAMGNGPLTASATAIDLMSYGLERLDVAMPVIGKVVFSEADPHQQAASVLHDAGTGETGCT